MLCLNPKYCDLALEITNHNVNFILNTANDNSIDFSYYTKRFSLGLIYSLTMFYTYKTKNIEKISSFINKRIKNIITFSKIKTNLINKFMNLAFK